MADEELAPEGDAGSELAPGAEDPNLQTDQPPADEGGDNDAPDPIADLATELGWVPKAQFRGNADDWKPADEFIRAGRDIQRNLSRDLRDVKTTVATMARTSAAIMEDRLRAQREELEGRFDQAVESGDTEAARAARTQLARLETEAPATVAPPPTPEGQNFAQKHAVWFNKDQEATNYALARADHYAKQGLAGARQLAAVEKDMKDVFPDLFPAPAKQPAAVHRPSSRSATASNRAKTFHDLPREAQEVARGMVDRGVLPNTEAYVKSYFENERKVG